MDVTLLLFALLTIIWEVSDATVERWRALQQYQAWVCEYCRFMVLPAALDADLRAGTPVALDITVWGGSLASHRAVITSAIARLSNQVAGRESTIAIEPVVLGEADDISLRQRLLPRFPW